MISSVDSTDIDALDKLDRGKHIAQTGVIIQLAAFGLFAVAAVRFNFTSKQFAKSLSERYEDLGEEYIIDGIAKNKHWPALLRVVNLTTILILVSFPL
jgi:TolB-like protein